MSSEALKNVADVDIDPQGVFKYILMKVYAKEVDGMEPSKMVVRGYKSCPYHSDIYDRVCSGLEPLSLDAECVGGGRINHDASNKKILVYGYSQGYGKADHKTSVDILKNVYKDYDIKWSDDGY